MKQAHKQKQTSAEQAHAKCTACGEVIARGAILCPKCGSYQGTWSRRLKYAAAIVSALAILGGAAAYVGRAAPNVRRYFSWRTDLRVFALDSTRGVSIANSGDGPVWLSHISIEIPGIELGSSPINQRVQPGQVTTMTWPTASTGATILINHATQSEWVRALAALKSNNKDNCVKVAVFSEDDSSYQTYAESDREDRHTMPELVVSTKLHYTDLKTGAGSIDIPSHGLLFVRKDCIRRLGLGLMETVTH